MSEQLNGDEFARDTPTPVCILSDDVDVAGDQLISGAVRQLLDENGLPIDRDDTQPSPNDNQDIPTVEPQNAIVDESLQPESDAWKNQQKHVFVLSQSGKPVYSRYGDEYRLATSMGVMQALVSFVASDDDQIKSLISGDRKFVFLVRENLILVCVSRTCESTSQLQLCLNYLYHQIISVLTMGFMKTQFEKRRNLDLRHYLVGAERFLDGIINYMEDEIGPHLNAVRCLPLPVTIREQVSNAMVQGIKFKDLVFAILLAGDQLISVVCQKRFRPHSMDLHILINYIRSSESFKNAQSWFPVCLPKFDADGFLFVFVSYLNEHMCLVLLTIDNNKVYQLKECKENIADRLSQNGLLDSILHACSGTVGVRDTPAAQERRSTNRDSNIQASGSSSGAVGGGGGVSGFVAPIYDGMCDVMLPVGVRHFICKYRSISQYTAPPTPFVPGLNVAARIRNYYLRLNHLLHDSGREKKLVYMADSMASYFAAVDDQCELYVTFEPLVTKAAAIQSISKIQKYVLNDKHRLFILSSPTF